MTGVAERSSTERAAHEIGIELRWSADAPVSIVALGGSALAGIGGASLVEVFTARENRARTSQGYTRSATGERLRYMEHRVLDRGDADELVVVQLDAETGVQVLSSIVRPHGTTGYRLVHEVRNAGTDSVVLTAVTSLSLAFGAGREALEQTSLFWGESQWLGEGRWHEVPAADVLPDLNLELHAQDGRGRWSRTSQGAWSSGEYLPGGLLVEGAQAIAWQIETSGAWHWELSQTRVGGTLSLLGPTANEHGFARRLAPGEGFESVPVSVVTSTSGRDGAFAALTRHRRWLRSARPVDRTLPVIYNDFMNTLMGDPSTEQLLPLVAAAAEAGAEYFCIDAGWFARPSTESWWSSVGEWREGSGRFTAGLAEVIDAIHARGMRAGLWLEPEVVGVHSPVAAQLPEDAFFHRFGERVREDDRYHLDFRHPAARAHLDTTVDHLVETYGISYFKLDYNINPGAGTETFAETAGDGLLGHTRAFRDWLRGIQSRHPSVLLENCASGAMRADYSLLSITHIQSTSDQQDFRLYPPIAASAPASIVPEQCGNWAYPAADMSDTETAFALLGGIVGRLYLAGFLHELRPAQRDLVAEAVRTHKSLRDGIAESVPFWPLGLPGWSDDVVVLGLDMGDQQLLAIWSRGAEARTIDIPGVNGAVETVFPLGGAGDGWSIAADHHHLEVSMPAGLTARVLRIANARSGADSARSGIRTR